MVFTLLPAVDVADGKAVRLAQGEAPTGSITGDPLAAALAWQAEGAEWIHLVDLDAAFGRGSNAALLASMIDQLAVRVELSGGIRDDASLDRALATGCDRVILSTDAIADLAWCTRVIGLHGERIAVGLDVQIIQGGKGSFHHQLAARGGNGIVGDLFTTIEKLDAAGCRRYVITDVSKDGMLAGPNLDLYRSVADVTSTPVIASGGVSEIDDLVLMAKAAAGANIEGSIVGRALYAGRFTLAGALEAMRQVEGAEPR